MKASTRPVKWCFEVSFETRRESKIEFPVAYRKCAEKQYPRTRKRCFAMGRKIAYADVALRESKSLF